MADRADLLEATVDCVPEGVAVFGEDCQLTIWNQAAQAITGFAPNDLVGCPVPEGLKPLLAGPEILYGLKTCDSTEARHSTRVHARHKLGHPFAAMARVLILHDALGQRIGAAILFHPTECLDALPHGITGDSEDVEANQVDLQDRLASLFNDFSQGGAAFGVLWITVDQAADLRRTHGAGACEAMFKKVEKALAQGLRPAEHLGRWGEAEFLVISHEPTSTMLAQHAQVLAGLARTADFRWWGDRVSLTVSIGVAQLKETMTLADVLERAKAAMFSSYQAGGNQIALAPGEASCSPS
jgi:diguanylate cyclase (GGDEF)-like protein/PAS domain S-box-containing protein